MSRIRGKTSRAVVSGALSGKVERFGWFARWLAGQRSASPGHPPPGPRPTRPAPATRHQAHAPPGQPRPLHRTRLRTSRSAPWPASAGRWTGLWNGAESLRKFFWINDVLGGVELVLGGG